VNRDAVLARLDWLAPEAIEPPNSKNFQDLRTDAQDVFPAAVNAVVKTLVRTSKIGN
jgi:hypothetical protein